MSAIFWTPLLKKLTFLTIAKSPEAQAPYQSFVWDSAKKPVWGCRFVSGIRPFLPLYVGWSKTQL